MNTVKANTVILTEGDLSKGEKKKEEKKEKKYLCLHILCFLISLANET